MVGKGGNYENDEQPPRYHGKRRNATTNIAHDNPSTSNRIYRVSQNPIHSRLSKNPNVHSQGGGPRRSQGNEYSWKNKNYNKQGASVGERQKQSREIYSTMSAVGRLKIGPKSYKIGDTNNEEVKPLLPSQPYCKLMNMSQEIFDLVVAFMQQYFTCYDKNRDELLAAYHSKALYSISFNLKSNASTNKRAARFGSYVRESRNLNYVKNEDRAFEMLHRSNIDIVAWLKKMPNTDHLASSFKLDVTSFQQHMITFSMSGIFKDLVEEKGYSGSLRAFHRTFVCVPVSNSQMIIVNEQVIISNLSDQQVKTYKEELQKLRVERTSESTGKSDPEPLMNSQFGCIVDEKQEMIKKFSETTNVNLKWSKDILEFSNWNFEEARLNFVNYRNDIPADAWLQNHIMN